MGSRWFTFRSHHAAFAGHISAASRFHEQADQAEPADAIRWLETPLDQFEGRTPRQTIASGEIERVTLLLDELRAAQEKKKAN